MKNIVDFFNKEGIIFRSLKEITPEELGTRKKIGIYLGVDIKGYFVTIIQLKKKSRVLLKEAKELEQLHKKLELYNESLIKNRYIIIEAPLCSKAKSYLESEGWKVWHTLKDKLLVDIGNTRVHILQDGKIVHISKERLFRQYGEHKLCYISVNHTLDAKLESKKNWTNLAQFLSIEGEYDTMGDDRKAICLSYESGIFVDAGSAITVDVVKEGHYMGGFILPGIKEYLKAYQSISPILEVEIDKTCDLSKLPKKTSGAISYGIISSIISSIKKERIAHKLPLYLTGGDGAWLVPFFKEATYDEGLLFKGLQNATKDKIC